MAAPVYLTFFQNSLRRRFSNEFHWYRVLTVLAQDHISTLITDAWIHSRCPLCFGGNNWRNEVRDSPSMCVIYLLWLYCTSWLFPGQMLLFVLMRASHKNVPQIPAVPPVAILLTRHCPSFYWWTMWKQWKILFKGVVEKDVKQGPPGWSQTKIAMKRACMYQCRSWMDVETPSSLQMKSERRQVLASLLIQAWWPCFVDMTMSCGSRTSHQREKNNIMHLLYWTGCLNISLLRWPLAFYMTLDASSNGAVASGNSWTTLFYLALHLLLPYSMPMATSGLVRSFTTQEARRIRLSDGEGCERLWSFLKPLIPSLRVSGVCILYIIPFYGSYSSLWSLISGFSSLTHKFVTWTRNHYKGLDIGSISAGSTVKWRKTVHWTVYMTWRWTSICFV